MEPMTSHELAHKLLELPDLPVATEASGYVVTPGDGHGCYLKIALLTHYERDYLLIGSIHRMNLNAPNWFVSTIFHGEADWDRPDPLTGARRRHPAEWEIERLVANTAKNRAVRSQVPRRR